MDSPFEVFLNSNSNVQNSGRVAFLGVHRLLIDLDDRLGLLTDTYARPRVDWNGQKVAQVEVKMDRKWPKAQVPGEKCLISWEIMPFLPPTKTHQTPQGVCGGW
jgi:hypothetical protein